MKGWLVVNKFMFTTKFQELYELLSNAFLEEGMFLELKTNDSILNVIGKGIENKPDFVLFWDKDIYLAEKLEEQGLKLFNSSVGVKNADNKILTMRLLSQNGIRIPKTIIAPKTFEGLGITDFSFLENIEKELSYPMIIKEAYGSFGGQVYLANNREEAITIIKGIGYKEFIFQEFISESMGRDIRVNVVGGKVVASMMRYNENDFRSNISNGGSMKQIDITPEQEEIAIKATKALGLDFAGVDVMFGEKPTICEVNSNPHFKSTLVCTGVDMSKEIAKYVKSKIKNI